VLSDRSSFLKSIQPPDIYRTGYFSTGEFADENIVLTISVIVLLPGWVTVQAASADIEYVIFSMVLFGL
jgi:hypothetical protein